MFSHSSKWSPHAFRFSSLKLASACAIAHPPELHEVILCWCGYNSDFLGDENIFHFLSYTQHEIFPSFLESVVFLLPPSNDKNIIKHFQCFWNVTKHLPVTNLIGFFMLFETNIMLCILNLYKKSIFCNYNIIVIVVA